MTRRAFITLLGGAAAWPLAARGQQSVLPVIGFLHQGPPEPNAKFAAGFRKGLDEAGYVEGRNIAIEYRWAQGEIDRLPELAADLVRRKVAVIATPGSAAAALAAKAATTTIPIVFMTGLDPLQVGLVASLNRPGGNVTGVGAMNVELGAKQLGLLHELQPGATPFAVFVNPASPQAGPIVTELQRAASTIGRQIEIVTVRTHRDVYTAFIGAVQKRAGALLITGDHLFTARIVQLATLAARHAMPAIYSLREFAEAGGLMSYGSNFAELYRLAGNYTGRVLKGEKPADLPIMQATKFEFVINLQTAEALGLTVPATLLARADEVIE
jgi:putative tryptophan/tyrosine transport system substrate-binding protein